MDTATQHSDKHEKRYDESYEQHAERIALAVGLRVEIKQGRPKCPKWGNLSISGTHCPYGKCNGFHGKHWSIALHPLHGTSYVFSFWQSLNDDALSLHKPTTYDVLTCLDWNGSTDPDEISEEYGGLKPSQAIACAEQNRALNSMFVVGSPWKRDALSMIS